MPTIRIAHKQRFTTIINETIEDTRLSFKARGVLVWLLSKPDGWKINADLIYQHGTEGRDVVLKALKELEQCGYLRREKVQMPGGQWRTVSTLYESPNPENQVSENQGSEIQGSKDQLLKASTENKNASVEGMADFWRAYPATRRGGSPSATRAWKKIAPDDHLALMLGLTLWVKHWAQSGTEDRFIPLAATWLNDRRWECPPEPKRELGSGPPGHRWSERRQIWIADGMG